MSPRLHMVGWLLVLSSCQASSFAWSLPQWAPKPWVPATNAMSAAKVELGRHLFYDPRLSVNGSMSCATCHAQERAFTDGKQLPLGSTSQQIPRNSMSLANVAFFYPYTWQNPLLETLEEQALVPMFAEAPIELGLTPVIDGVLDAMRSDSRYPRLFADAFPGESNPRTVANVVAAIAAFERTLISADSAYDR